MAVVLVKLLPSKFIVTRKMEYDLQSFMRSEKSLENKDFPTSNIAIVLGPSKSGKSYLIKKGLNTFSRNMPANNRLVIHIDLSGYGFLSFDTFRHRFETAFIDQITEGVSESQTPLYIHAMKQSLYLIYEKSMLNLLLQRCLARLVNDQSAILLSLDCRHTLAEYYHNTFDNQSLPEDPFSALQHLSKLVSKDLGISEFAALLHLVKDVCIEKDTMENSNGNDLNVSGLEFVDVFFDMLNYVAGYHTLNNFETQQNSLDKFVNVLLAIGIHACKHRKPRYHQQSGH